jgi:phosphoribosylglycinamide formyltransferase-1
MEPRLNVLVAYPYMNQRMIDLLVSAGSSLRFNLDSGAFTAWKAGKQIGLDEYCRFLEGLPIKPWRYFTLDVIGDPGETLRNYETMLARGFKPVPIFTRGEDPSVLEQFYKTSEVVGIGGLVGTPRNRGFVKAIMKHIGDRKVHWLGFTDFNFVKTFRPYMCDSSSWESAARYGALKLYMGGGRFKGIKKAQYFGVKTVVIESKTYKLRKDFEQELVNTLAKNSVNFIVLAGFMRILTPNFVNKYQNKIVNTHPSLLPSFKGANAVKDAIEYGVKITGTTVHYVNSELDEGKIIAQDWVSVLEGDTIESLHERIKQKERILYPKTIDKLLNDLEEFN